MRALSLLAVLVLVTGVAGQPLIPRVVPEASEGPLPVEADRADESVMTAVVETDAIAGLLERAVPLFGKGEAATADLLALIESAEDLAESTRNEDERLVAETVRIAGYFRLVREAQRGGLSSVASFRLAQARGVAARMAGLDHPEAKRCTACWRLLLELCAIENDSGARGDHLAALLSFLADTADGSLAGGACFERFERGVLELAIGLQMEQGNVASAGELARRLERGHPGSAAVDRVVAAEGQLGRRVPGALLRAIDYRVGQLTPPVRAVVLLPWGSSLDAPSRRALDAVRRGVALRPMEARVVLVGGVIEPGRLEGWEGAQGWVPGSEADALGRLGIDELPAYLVIDSDGRLATLGFSPATLRRSAVIADRIPQDGDSTEVTVPTGDTARQRSDLEQDSLLPVAE
ncbi:hypothetical protein [Mucisphaera calidilacus]|uniref:Uncharacterized protein n=1 Tax=Mucisphaera calidilacus TaxID=2527982 RepID=A0A518BYN2_9BACT|nr:hypothetical protein [Mucisphaera calidilacus]QDU72081.1 hypothetical protein Pan265_19430 [Mucisphaera calidilacus]